MQVPDAFGGIADYFAIHHSAAGLDASAWIRWGIIIALTVMVAFWHQHQNKAFHEYINNKNRRTSISDRLSQLAYNRSFEVITLCFLLILCVVFYDTRINSAENRILAARANVVAMEEEIAVYEEQMALKDQQVQEAIRLSGMDEAQQVELDTIKQEFEGLFINYYMLKKCNLGSRQDFHIMNSALMYRLNTLNAPSGIRQNILNAANGSFDELYTEQVCEGEELAAMQDEVRNYLRDVVENLPDK